MGSNVLTSLIQDAILKLCTQHVTFDASLEIDGIICITPGLDAKEIVVKMHRTIMKPVTQPDQYAPEMDTNPSTPSSTSSATPHKRQRNRQGRDIDPNAYPQNVTSNVSFDEMPKPSIYDEDSGGGGYYSSEQQQQYATPDSTPSKSRKRRAAPAPEASTEEKYIKVEPGESEILVEEPTSVTPGNSNDGYTDPNQGPSLACYTTSPRTSRRYKSNVSRRGLVSKKNTCSLCGKVYTSKENLCCHMRSTHDAELLKCPQCEVKGFITKDALKRHVDSKHRHIVYVCNPCGVRFENKKTLKEHQKGLHEKERYLCPLCGKKFRWRASLKKHRHVHL